MGQNIKKILFACVLMLGATAGANALTVSYDCGTSTGTAPTDSTVYDSGDSVTVKPNTCDVPSGKHFAGYICDSTDVAAGNTFTISSNTTCTAQYENGKFAVKTTNTTTVLNFKMTAAGTFTVDCGDNGTLTDDATTTTVSGNTITRSNTTAVTYTCTWDTAGAHTITFDGTGTGYSASYYVGVIGFYIENHSVLTQTNAAKIESISGSLYNLFPSTGTGFSQIPQFYSTFQNATNLKSIPSTLFSGYTVERRDMFGKTFYNCALLTSIPKDLFSWVTYAKYAMFGNTFQYCIRLKSIPDDLFRNITATQNNAFFHTFDGCTSLTSIPDTLFSGITVGRYAQFLGTFQNCTRLTSLPPNLFANITTGAEKMFNSTFSGCTNLSGYVPSTLFAGLIANNVAYETDMMGYIFYNTGLDKSCPNGTTRYETPYDSYWSSKVSCTPNVITINWNGALQSDIDANNAGTMIYGGDIRTPLKPDPSQIPVGKYFKGWKFVKSVQE